MTFQLKRIKISRNNCLIQVKMQHFLLQTIHQDIFVSLFGSIKIDNTVVLLVRKKQISFHKSEPKNCFDLMAGYCVQLLDHFDSVRFGQ